MTMTDWPHTVALTIDALHAMPPEDRTIVRIWLAKQDEPRHGQLSAENQALADRCREHGVDRVAYLMGIKSNTLYARLNRLGVRFRKKT